MHNEIDKEGFIEIFKDAKNRIKTYLIPIESISDIQASQILARYAAAFEGNFITWMAAASVSARSIYSKFAADENIYVEIQEDHPGMLRRFVTSAGVQVGEDAFLQVQNEVNSLRKLVSEISGLKNITLMAVLENTSTVFIPYLYELAAKLNATDFMYTNVHGEADIKHAEQFLEAMEKEYVQGYSQPMGDISETVELTCALLEKIFKI